MSKQTFVIQNINRSVVERKQRAELLENLFMHMGMGNPKLFSHEMDITTLTCEEQGVKVVFTVSGLSVNQKITISSKEIVSKQTKVLLAVDEQLDFEKTKAL